VYRFVLEGVPVIVSPQCSTLNSFREELATSNVDVDFERSHCTYHEITCFENKANDPAGTEGAGLVASHPFAQVPLSVQSEAGGLMEACRLIRGECLPLLFSWCVFCIDNIALVKPFFSNLPDRARKQVRHMDIELRLNDPEDCDCTYAMYEGLNYMATRLHLSSLRVWVSASSCVLDTFCEFMADDFFTFWSWMKPLRELKNLEDFTINVELFNMLTGEDEFGSDFEHEMNIYLSRRVLSEEGFREKTKRINELMGYDRVHENETLNDESRLALSTSEL
jgi:hypothetical protein